LRLRRTQKGGKKWGKEPKDTHFFNCNENSQLLLSQLACAESWKKGKEKRVRRASGRGESLQQHLIAGRPKKISKNEGGHKKIGIDSSIRTRKKPHQPRRKNSVWERHYQRPLFEFHFGVASFLGQRPTGKIQ